jgi:hypothetical protein
MSSGTKLVSHCSVLQLNPWDSRESHIAFGLTAQTVELQLVALIANVTLYETCWLNRIGRGGFNKLLLTIVINGQYLDCFTGLANIHTCNWPRHAVSGITTNNVIFIWNAKFELAVHHFSENYRFSMAALTYGVSTNNKSSRLIE